jgi:hypothetical protein
MDFLENDPADILFIVEVVNRDLLVLVNRLVRELLAYLFGNR